MGPAELDRPPADAPIEAYLDYVYRRDNPRGAHRELYYHAYGCRAWLVVSRQTHLHQVSGADAVMAADGSRGETA